MRNRLIRSTLVIALISVITLGIPLAVLARNEVTSRASDRLRSVAARVAAGLEDRLDAGRPVDPAKVTELAPDKRVVVAPSSGSTITTGRAIHGETDSATVAVGGAHITVTESHHDTEMRAREVVLLVMALGGIATVAAVALAVGQARRLAAPLGLLAARADSLGQGTFTATPLSTGIPEVDAISRQLERSAAQIGTLVGLQRDFASDAAHQLRTPLTGIGLRLEEIALVGRGAVKEEAEAALLQVERLDKVIGTLLARARGDSSPPTQLDLAALVRDEATVWQRVLGGQHRTLVLRLDDGATVLARREHISSILTSLLDNALEHGAGLVTVSVKAQGSTVVLSVGDDGPGVPEVLAGHVFERSVSGAQGTGIGLSLARSLAEAEGGRLTLSPRSRSELVLSLPRTA